MTSLANMVGKFNEVHPSAKISDTARICGWCYIGPDVVIGDHSVIGNFCEINSGARIGSNTLINSHCHLNSGTRVGNNVILGSGVLTADEKYMTPITSKIQKRPCVIGDHVKIGQGARLVCTSIGNYASIGASSTVLADHVPAHEVWVGTPARKIRMTTADEDEMSHT